ncbi:MAG: hypothetical protein JW726_09260 [Anaerolineales bacterium]|nr:hypothetical protein [Anaerolineales bacterium]
MGFQEIEEQYAALRQQLDQRQISPQTFHAAVSRLRVQGPDGMWWQMCAEDGAWLRWNGRVWVPTPPPQVSAPTPGAAMPRPAPQAPRPPAAAAAPMAAPQPRRAKPARAPQKPPESLVELGLLILRGMFKSFFIKLLFAFLTLIFVWVLHTYLLVGPNGGFFPGVSPVLDAILALQGQMASGTLFWGMLFGLISMVLARVWQMGPAGTAKMVISTPKWLVSCFQQTRMVSLPILTGNAAIALIVGTVINNRPITLLLVLASLGAIIAQNTSLPGVVARLAWSDAQRLLGKKRPYHPGWTGSAVVGLGLGFLAAAILPFVPYCGLGGAFFLIGITGLTIFLLLFGKPKAGATLMVLLLAFSLLAAPALADDGGWEEAGGTLGDWLQSQGAVQAIVQGLPPAAAATFLGWLATTLGQSLSTVYGPGIKDIKPGDLTAAIPTALGLNNLANRLDLINDQLGKDGYYVRNFFQGDPTLIVQGLDGLGGIIWDETAGRWTGSKGITCEGYVDVTFDKVKDAVSQQFPGAKVQSILFEEKSSADPKSWGDSIDALNSENHNLIKVTLPDGSEWAVDFHQHNSHIIDSRAPSILRPWKDAKQEWVDYLGKNEFTESVVK